MSYRNNTNKPVQPFNQIIRGFLCNYHYIFIKSYIVDNYQNLSRKGESSETHYVNVFVFNEDQCFYLNYHKIFIIIICLGCVLESPRRGDSNTHPQHMILWRNIEN